MKKVNVYDFDKTIYDGDSTVDFYFFCLTKKPIILRYIFLQAFYFIKYIFGFCSKTKFKEKFFIFLKGVKNIDLTVRLFWKKKEQKIQKWYLIQKKPDDIVISASPEFLLMPICGKLGISAVIATKVDKRTGNFLGENCYGEEKVERFQKQFGNVIIKEFYSDSLSDSPLANMSEKAFFVHKKTILEWEKAPQRKIKKAFLSKEFIGFFIIGIINAINGIVFAYLFSLLIHTNIAFVCGYILSLTIAYILNSFLAFKEKLSLIKYFKFIVAYLPNFIIQNSCVLIFYNWLRVGKLLTFTLAAAVGIPITFLILRFFTFAKKKN